MASLIQSLYEPMSVETAVLSGPLLDDLHNGERAAFVRFYELVRWPVYNLAWRLMRGRGDAAAITSEIFLTAYRQILLHDGPIDPRPWIYRVTVDVCSGHAEDVQTSEWPSEPARTALGRASARRGHDELASNFEQALMVLSGRHHLALLLKDIHGLRLDEIAAVLGLSEETAKATLFRAREDFRRAFEEQSQGRRDQSCRLAEQAAAGSVGRGMAVEELRKLREHAEYCRRCRRTMRSWSEGVSGLALFLREAPLPVELQAVPVFGAALAGAGQSSTSATAARAAGAAGTAGGAGIVSRAFGRTGRALSSRSTAYAVTLACLVASAGVIAYVAQHDWTRIVRVPQIVRVRQLVPGPVRTVQAKPTTRVTPRQNGGSIASAGSAVVTPRASQPVTRSAVYKVPAKTTTSDDTPAAAGSTGGSSPAPAKETPAKDKHPSVPAGSATTNDGNGSHSTTLLGHANKGNGRHADHPAASVSAARTGHRTHVKGQGGTQGSDTLAARHPGQHDSVSRRATSQGSGHSSGQHANGRAVSSRGGAHTHRGGSHGGGTHAHGSGGGRAGHGQRRG
jgi:RNA polymerase sigma factor (sigma-70 family)